jgi:phosphate transport system permease protein
MTSVDLTSQLSPSRRIKDVTFRITLTASILAALGFIFAVIFSLWNDSKFLLSREIIFNFPSFDPDQAGFQSPIMGSIWVVTTAALIALPIGILTALYLEEFSPKKNRLVQLLELNIQNLAGVPAVVFGLIGLAFIARGPLGWGFTVGSASLVLAMMILPVVIIVSRESIRAVPPSYKEGALALGATQWQAVSRLVLPSSIPGTATGSILAVSRAMGESAPLLLLGALSFVTFNPDGLDSPFTVLPLAIFKYSIDSREEFHYIAAAGSLILVAILFSLNLIAILLRDYTTRKNRV